MTDNVRAEQVNERKTGELEDILETSQRLTERLGEICDRLGAMSGRLSGDTLSEVAAEGTEPSLPGLIGSFKSNLSVTFRRLDSIDEWITHIEQVV